MTVYSPKIFEEFIKTDSVKVNIPFSLDLNSNHKRILKSTGQGDGGAGGEFFYQSFDNKLIIKTLPH